MTRRFEDGPIGAGFDDRVEHQADLLGQRQPGEQIVDALGDAQLRVLVGVHDAVAVQVPIGDAHGSGRDGGLHGSPR